MTDGQTLFAVFALLYLIECLRLQPPTSWMASGSGKSRWGLIRPWARLQLAGGSPLLLSALPPMNAHTVALPWLFVPEAEGLRVLVGDAMRLTVPWETLAPRPEEAMLHLDSVTRVRLLSADHAKVWAERLAGWQNLPPEKRRAAFMSYACSSLNTDTAEKTAQESARRTRALRAHATVIFLWCFGVISSVYHRFGDGPMVLYVAGGLLLLQWVQCWLFLRASRPVRSHIPQRLRRALGIAFLPQLSMRAADAVSLATGEEPPHPLAWRKLLDDTVWLEAARRFWREARYIPGWSTQDETLPPEANALRAFFKQQDIADTDYDPHLVSRLPTCPRCHAEFQVGASVCKDCGGVELCVTVDGSKPASQSAAV